MDYLLSRLEIAENLSKTAKEFILERENQEYWTSEQKQKMAFQELKKALENWKE